MSLGRRAGAGVVVLAAVLAGCATPAPPPQAPAISPPPQAQSHRDGAQAEVSEIYGRFWSVAQSLPQRPVERWRPELSTVATSRLADTMLANLARHREHGITVYGEIHPRITDVRVEGSRAVVTDCQDASHSGQADARTGDPRTVGIARNLVAGTLEHTPEGSWRVARIDYPDGDC